MGVLYASWFDVGYRFAAKFIGRKIPTGSGCPNFADSILVECAIGLDISPRLKYFKSTLFYDAKELYDLTSKNSVSVRCPLSRG